MKSAITLAAALLAAIALPSCESPELTQKRDAQLLEITRLKGELVLMEEKVKNLPEDRSIELRQVTQEADAKSEELAKLEEEVAALEAKKAALEKEFEDYKRKYAIR